MLQKLKEIIIEKQEKKEKNRKKTYLDLKNKVCWCILCSLFAGVCVYAAESAAIKTDPATGKNLAEISRLKAENRLLQEEKRVIRKELLETLEKNTMLTEKLKRLELSAAALTESLEPVYMGSREEESVESLRTVMQSSVALASATESLCEMILKQIAEYEKKDPVSAAKLRILINSAQAEIRRIAFLNSTAAPPGGFRKCRILNIDFSLNAAVVSAGYRNGVRNGMLLYSPDGSVVIQIAAVRNFTSAGIISRGDVRKLGIGMEMSVKAVK